MMDADGAEYPDDVECTPSIVYDGGCMMVLTMYGDDV